MTDFTRYHPAIIEALELVEDVDPGAEQDAKRALIATALVHSDEDETRRQLLLIESKWHRYQVSIELYAAYARSSDEARVQALIRQMQTAEESDGSDEREQLRGIKRKLAEGWRSKPEQVLLDPQEIARRLERSRKRVTELKNLGGPVPIVLGEYCLRVMYGDVDAIGPARKLAGNDAKDRDRITLAIGKSYAYMGKIASAKEHLGKIVFPENRIDLLVTIYRAERELSPDGECEVLH